MHLRNLIAVLVLAVNMVACNGQNQGVKNLSAEEFDKGIQKEGIQLVDVRTPEEYSEKHIKGSQNFNVNGSEFEKQMSTLDKNKPVYIYCLSGGRSSSASNWAAKNGFKEVYNMNGGITAWLGANKPVETASGGKVDGGMTFDEYLSKIKSDKLVLVDFNAVWCGPCKVLKPIVTKVVKKNADKVELFDIDVDKNSTVANSMNINAIPLILLYKDGKEVWRQMGLTDEDTLTAKIAEFSK